MKKIFAFSLLLCLLTLTVTAQKGYDIQVSFKQPVADTVIYLAKYYAKPLPNVYLVDSAAVDSRNQFRFQTSKETQGGIYLLLFKNKGKWMDIVMSDDLKVKINIDTLNVYGNSEVEGDKENVANLEFQKAAEVFGVESQRIIKKYKLAKSSADSAQVKKELDANSEKFVQLRRAFIKKNKESFLTKLLVALERPEVPEGPHYLDDGKTVDSFFAYRYTKRNYWKNFDFQDNRMVFAPIYDSKLKDYFDNYVVPIPDSINFEADRLLEKSRGADEVFKYTLHWLGRYTRLSKVMGLDESFVHLVENYYMKGDAVWLDSTQLHKYYIEPAQKIAPNVIGNAAPGLLLSDAYTLQPTSLRAFSAKYTLLMFWSPDCGYCKTQIPLIDSVYKNSLQARGLKIFSVPHAKNLTEIHDVVKEMGIRHWSHNIDTKGDSEYQSKYNVYQTPVLYLLDEEKKIRGKNLSYKDLEKLIDYIEEKNKK